MLTLSFNEKPNRMGFATMKGRASIITSPIINNSQTFVNEKYLNRQNFIIAQKTI